MMQHDTNRIQALLNLYPNFGGKDKGHLPEYSTKTSFAWVCHSIGKAPPPSLGQDKIDNHTKFLGRDDVDARERQTFQHAVHRHGGVCQQCREIAHKQDSGGWGRYRASSVECPRKEVQQLHKEGQKGPPRIVAQHQDEVWR